MVIARAVSRAVVVAVIAAAAFMVAAVPAAADEFCTGTLGAVTVDQVVVPDGATCKLVGTTVLANVKVGVGSTLFTFNAHVVGNVEGDGAYEVRIIESVTDGNIQLKNTTHSIAIGVRGCRFDPAAGANIQLEENSAEIRICQMSIREDLQLVKNTGTILVRMSVIGGNLQVFENTNLTHLKNNRAGEDLQVNKNTGGVLLTNNHAGANLQCTENEPLPQGSGNTADGLKEGQCENL